MFIIVKLVLNGINKKTLPSKTRMLCLSFVKKASSRKKKIKNYL